MTAHLLHRSRRAVAALFAAALALSTTAIAQETKPGAPGQFLFGADFPPKPSDAIDLGGNRVFCIEPPTVGDNPDAVRRLKLDVTHGGYWEPVP